MDFRGSAELNNPCFFGGFSMLFPTKEIRIDVLNRSSRFATIRIATGLQRFQIARFESQGQKHFESLLMLYYFFFTFKIGFALRDSIRWRFRIARSVIRIANRIPYKSEDFSLLVAFLLVTFSWLFRGFFVALFGPEKQCSGFFRYFFVVFSWLFRGPRFGQILRVLALERSSE